MAVRADRSAEAFPSKVADGVPRGAVNPGRFYLFRLQNKPTPGIFVLDDNDKIEDRPGAEMAAKRCLGVRHNP
mgnify:CR=1 FL=1